MPVEQRFLRAILAAPEDDTPRLAYADWLSERGDPRGELIRVQCRLARLPDGGPEHLTLQQRETQLLQAHYDTWTKELERMAPGAWVVFRRGFPDTLTAYDVEDEALRGLALVPTLRALELSGQALTAEGLRHLQALPLVQQLDLTNLALTDEALRALAGARTLRVLSLSLDGLTPAGLAHLEGLPELLVVRHEEEPTPEVAAVLERLKQRRMERFRHRSTEERRREAQLVLEAHGGNFVCAGGLVKKIHLSQCWVTDNDLEYLTAFPELESLDLYEVRASSAGLRHLAGLDNLRELQLGKTPVRSLEPLAGLTRLTRLHAAWLQDEESRSCLTDEGTRGLEHLRSLEDLDLSAAAITDVTLHRLARLTRLRRLRLSSVQGISDEGLKGLAHLRELEELDLGYGSSLSDAGLHLLMGLTRLRALDLEGQHITDAGLLFLHAMRDLECLELHGTAVTVGAAERLLEALPGAAIGVANTMVKRLPSVVHFRRVDVDGRASIAVPRGWGVLDWHLHGPEGNECFQGHLREDGYEHRHSYPGDSGPGEAWLYRRPAEPGKSATDVVTDHVEHDDGHDLEGANADVQRLPHTDGASRRFRTGFGRKLVCVWLRGGSHYEVACDAPVARWPLLAPLFAQMVRSFWFAEDGPAPGTGPVVRAGPVGPRRAPTREEEALRQAITAAPGEDGPRLRYADWLGAQGDPLGELIRVQIEREHCNAPERRRALLAREKQLREAHEGEWLRPLQSLGLSDPLFRGGLVEAGTVAVQAFVDHAAELFAAAPALHQLRLVWASSALPALVRSPHLARLTRLGLRCGAVSAEELGRLLASPHLAGLHELEACANQLGPEAARAVARATHLRSLTRLDLCCNHLGDAGLEALAGAPHLGSLTALDLGGNQLTERGVRALVASQYLTRLTSLNLGGKQLGPVALALLAEAANLGALRELCLHGAPIEDAGLQALARSSRLTRLEALDLSSGDWTDAGIKALVESPVVDGLASLSILCAKLTAAGLEAIAHSPRLGRLRRLEVGGNAIGDEGVAALAGSPLLARLTYLNVSNTGLTAEGVRALTTKPAVGSLRTLYLGANCIGDGGLEALLNCPYLDGLERIDASFNESGRGALRAFRERFRDQIERW
jgi:uncharacterized protein (TIGR02996 family)